MLSAGDHALPRLGMAVVRGRSMTPTLHEGDRLLVQVRRPPASGLRSRSCGSPTGWSRSSGWTTGRRDGWWVVRDNAFEGRDSWSGGAIAEGGVLALARAAAVAAPGATVAGRLR